MLYVENGGGTSYRRLRRWGVQHLAWYLNLKADSEAWVEIGDRTLRVRAEEARDEEKRRLFWARLVEIYPPYENYQRRTEREIPIVVLHPVN
jgi:proline iminopeptidase